MLLIVSRTLNISISQKVVGQVTSLGRGLIYIAINCNIVLVLTIASSSSSSSSIHKVIIFKIHLPSNFKEDQPIEGKFQTLCIEINKSWNKITDTNNTVMYLLSRMIITTTMKIAITIKTLF